MLSSSRQHCRLVTAWVRFLLLFVDFAVVVVVVVVIVVFLVSLCFCLFVGWGRVCMRPLATEQVVTFQLQVKVLVGECDETAGE